MLGRGTPLHEVRGNIGQPQLVWRLPVELHIDPMVYQLEHRLTSGACLSGVCWHAATASPRPCSGSRRRRIWAPEDLGAEHVDTVAAALRLPLVSDTYNDIRASHVARLAEHDAHRNVALSVVRDEFK